MSAYVRACACVCVCELEALNLDFSLGVVGHLREESVVQLSEELARLLDQGRLRRDRGGDICRYGHPIQGCRHHLCTLSSPIIDTAKQINESRTPSFKQVGVGTDFDAGIRTAEDVRHCTHPPHAHRPGAPGRRTRTHEARPPARPRAPAHLEVGLEQQVDVVLADLRVPAGRVRVQGTRLGYSRILQGTTLGYFRVLQGTPG